MKKIVFYSSMLDIHENPDPEWLKKLVFERGESFWSIGSGTAAIHFEEDGKKKAELWIMFSKKHGFIVKYSLPGPEGLLTLVTTKERSGKTGKAHLGGQMDAYYIENFVPRETAWEAIEYFLETGEMKPSLIWDDSGDMPEDDD